MPASASASRSRKRNERIFGDGVLDKGLSAHSRACAGSRFPVPQYVKKPTRESRSTHVMSEIEQTRSVRIPKMSWGRCSGEEAVSVTEYLERARECVGPCRPHEWRGQEEVARNCRGLDQDGNCRGSRGGGQAHRSVARQQGAIGRPLRRPHTSIVTIPCR